MASDWIPMRIHLERDPAVIMIGETLKLDKFAVIGRLHFLWGWANENLQNGNAVGVTFSWIDNALLTPGFAEAMSSAGWLHKSDDGIIFPNFDVWNSKSAKRRILTAKRAAEFSKRKKANAALTQPALVFSDNNNASGVENALAIEEKRREYKKTKEEDSSEPAKPASEQATASRPPFDSTSNSATQPVTPIAGPQAATGGTSPPASMGECSQASACLKTRM